MKNQNEDVISERSYIDSDNSLESAEINGSNISKSNDHGLCSFKRVSENDIERDSKNKYSAKDTVHKKRKNQLNSLELENTINTELGKNVCSENSASVNSIFNFENLTSDDEVYMFQCPDTYRDLLHKNMGNVLHENINNIKQTITNKTEAFKTELINFKKKFITLALPNKSKCGTLVKLPLKGHIIIDKVVEIHGSNHLIDKKNDCSKIIFPKDIKIRHPLLGVDWDAHIKEANKALKSKNYTKINKNKEEKVVETKKVFKKLKRKGCKVEHLVPIIKNKKHEC